MVLLAVPECSACPEWPVCIVCDGYDKWGRCPGATGYPEVETAWLEADWLTVCKAAGAAEEPGPGMETPPVKPFLSPGLRKVFRYRGSLIYASSP